MLQQLFLAFSSLSVMLGNRRCLTWQSWFTICLFPLSVLAQTPQYYDNAFIYNFTKGMYLRQEVECFVTFVADRTPQKPLADELFVRTLHRSLSEDLNLPTVTWGLKGNVSLSPILTSKTLIFGTILELSPKLEPILEVIHTSLFGRHNLRVIFIKKIFNNVLPTLKELRDFFAWCWRRNLINVVLTFQQLRFTNGSHEVRNELFTYNPFPKLKLLNVTKFGISYKWKSIDVKNVKGYEFHVPVFQDGIKAFVLPDGQLYGNFGMLVSAYINHTNGRLHVEPTPDVNLHNYHNTTLLAASRGEIDIGVHSYTDMTLNSELGDGLLTFTYSQACIIVPRHRELPIHRSARYGLRRNGMLLVFILVSLTVGWHVYSRKGYDGFYYALAIFHLQPVDEVVFHRYSNAYKIIHVSFLMNAFLMWNMRIAYLSASFSTRLGDPQIKNVKDFMRSPLRIMVTETQVEMYFTRPLLPAALQERLLVVNASTLQDHLDNLNTSYAYCSTDSHWQLVQLQQKQLCHPLFIRVAPKLCTPLSIRHIPLQWNSPFRENLLWFYVDSHRNGFYKKWQEFSFMKAVQVGMIKIFKDVEIPYERLKVHDFQVVMIAYFHLIAFCLLCLLGEIVWKYRLHLLSKVKFNVVELIKKN